MHNVNTRRKMKGLEKIFETIIFENFQKLMTDSN